jgi:hypothetical protein
MRRTLTVLAALAFLAAQMAASLAIADGPTEAPASADPACPCCPDDAGAAECVATCLAMTGAIVTPEPAAAATGGVVLVAAVPTFPVSHQLVPPTPPPID